jgi:uncharacterized membrane protein YccC
MADAVDRLAELVAELATQQNERLATLEERLARAEERQADGLEGIGRLGGKVGALAEAMKENMAETAKARERLVADQEARLSEFRALGHLAAEGAGAIPPPAAPPPKTPAFPDSQTTDPSPEPQPTTTAPREGD